jgi:hypothetical protein
MESNLRISSTFSIPSLFAALGCIGVTYHHCLERNFEKKYTCPTWKKLASLK